MHQQQEEKEITEDPGEQQDQSFESFSKKSREKYAYLKVPYDILNSPRLLQTADRAKISDRSTVGLLAATLKSFKSVDDEEDDDENKMKDLWSYSKWLGFDVYTDKYMPFMILNKFQILQPAIGVKIVCP